MVTFEDARRICWAFPGQGSQSIGMAAPLASRMAAIFERASDVVGWDVRAVAADGPRDLLDRTDVAQVAILTTSVSAAAALDSQAHVMAGHSVGEFAALVAAGAMGFEDALRAVAARGSAMARAGARTPGGMAAILGLEEARVDQVLDVVEGVVAVANVNGPDQIVISGERSALDAAIDALRAAGARRAIPLPVSVAAHSPLMAPVVDELADVLGEVAWRRPRVPVALGVTGRLHDDPAEFAPALCAAVTSRVRWTEIVHTLAETGVQTVIEVGSGTVLAGLIRRIRPEMQTISAFDLLAEVSHAAR